MDEPTEYPTWVGEYMNLTDEELLHKIADLIYDCKEYDAAIVLQALGFGTIDRGEED